MKNEDLVSNDRSPASGARLLALFLAGTAGMTATASDWRQFRGPNGSGIAAIVGHQLFLRSNRFLYCIECWCGRLKRRRVTKRKAII